jgi:uncharacterized membrane protein
LAKGYQRHAAGIGSVTNIASKEALALQFESISFVVIFIGLWKWKTKPVRQVEWAGPAVQLITT